MKIPATLKRFTDKIQSIDDERGTGNGYWVNLKNGFIDTESGCHAIHENSLVACAGRFQFVEPCDCEDCRPKAQKCEVCDRLDCDINHTEELDGEPEGCDECMTYPCSCDVDQEEYQ